MGEKSPTFYLLTIKYNTNYGTSYNIRNSNSYCQRSNIGLWNYRNSQIDGKRRIEMIFSITIGRRSFGSFCFINNIPLKNIKSNSANTNYLQHISVLLNNIKSNFAIIIIHFYFKSSFLFMIYNSNKIEININN